MSQFAPTDYFQGPTSLVMQILENTGNKGIQQNVALVGSNNYIASIWVKPDRACNWLIQYIPPSGGTIHAQTTSLVANEWHLCKILFGASTGYGTITYTTDATGIFELCAAQICRQIDQYDPAKHVILNEWTRGGLADDPTISVHVERFDDELPFDWSPVLAEQDGDVSSFQTKALTGGAFTYSLRDLYFPLDTDLYYRAHINHDTAGVSSPDSGAAPVAAQSDWRWLMIPTLPGRTGERDSGDVLQVFMSSPTFDADSSNASAAFNALGRKNAIVISDITVNSDGQTMSLGFRDANSYAIFERIRAANCTVLLRAGRYGFQKWIRFTGNRSSSIFLGTGNVRPSVTVQWVEVDPPESV